MTIPTTVNKTFTFINKDKNPKAYTMEFNLDDEKVQDYLEKFAQVNYYFNL